MFLRLFRTLLSRQGKSSYTADSYGLDVSASSAPAASRRVQCAIPANARQIYGNDHAKHSISTTIRIFLRSTIPSRRVSMPKQHTYVLGLNTYDHDVSACLLRDGAIAFAIAKERITREKHASGFYKEVIDYCLQAEGITLDDVDLVVRNSYILPVPEMEQRLLHQDMPGFLPIAERDDAVKHPLFRSTSDKVVAISHHLAHAYSAFAVSPFRDGVVMIVDGVGNYQADTMESCPQDAAT